MGNTQSRHDDEDSRHTDTTATDSLNADTTPTTSLELDVPAAESPPDVDPVTGSTNDFSCQPCGKSFSRKRALNRHIRETKRHRSDEDNTDRLFKCPLCSKTCARAYDLRRHVRELHNSTTINCTDCGRDYRPGEKHEETCLLNLELDVATWMHDRHGNDMPVIDEVTFSQQELQGIGDGLMSLQYKKTLDGDFTMTQNLTVLGVDISETAPLSNEMTHIHRPSESRDASLTQSDIRSSMWNAIEGIGCTLNEVAVCGDRVLDWQSSEPVGMRFITGRKISNRDNSCIVGEQPHVHSEGIDFTNQPKEFSCGYCHMPFQLNRYDLHVHLARHLVELCFEHTCVPCQISFVRQQDLLHHRNVVAKDGVCGFTFEHSTAQCPGHHPPLDVDRRHFQERILNWERSQLLLFTQSVDRLVEWRKIYCSRLRRNAGDATRNEYDDEDHTIVTDPVRSREVDTSELRSEADSVPTQVDYATTMAELSAKINLGLQMSVATSL